MKITVATSKDNHTITEYFDFNRIEYELVDFWQKELDSFGRYIIGPEISEDKNRLLILSYNIFNLMCMWPPAMNQIIKFCKHNTIWIWDDIDSLVSTIFFQKNKLLDIDTKVPAGSIKLFLDGKWSDRFQLTKLTNLQYTVFPYSYFINHGRIENSICDKVNCSKDFMLTMVKKSSRQHRQILFNKLSKYNNLLECGHVNYKTSKSDRIGLQPHQTEWGDGYPSMDLYQDSWLEIVPETLFRDGFFITEKTIKPILTKTPFLIVSTCKYLEYLRQHGFKTFGHIIDERYDQQYRIEDRVQLMLAQLHDIIQNGSESFYKECKEVLEHNQNRLFEISGRRQYDTDIFILSNLENARKVLKNN